MLFKLDENISEKAIAILREYGHDAMTVHEQGLTGYGDDMVAQVCRSENRAIMTYDLDFADVRVFRPELYAGIIVFRIEDQSWPAFRQVLQFLIPLLTASDLAGKLWIVDEAQIRIWPQELHDDF